METITIQQKKDIKLLGKFTEIFCRAKHRNAEFIRVSLPAALGVRTICPECRSFLEYAIAKRLTCPLEAEKPTCKKCRIHCYDRQRRDKVREIMSYVGRRMVMRGRLDYLWHYFF